MERTAWFVQGHGHFVVAFTVEDPGQVLTAWCLKGYSKREGPPSWMIERWSREREDLLAPAAAGAAGPAAALEEDQEFLQTVIDKNTCLGDLVMGYRPNKGVQVSFTGRQTSIYVHLRSPPQLGAKWGEGWS